MVKELHNAIVTNQEKEKDGASPFDNHMEFDIPGLAIAVGDQIEMFEESYFLDRKWNVLDYTPVLDAREYGSPRSLGKLGEVDVDSKGEIKSRFITELQDQLELITQGNSGWSNSDLTIWIDKRISHPDISTMKSIPYINAIINNLISERKLNIDELVNDRYRLKNAISSKISGNRDSARTKGYQIKLFADDSPVIVDEKNAFHFSTNMYPASTYYKGHYEFLHHYYKHVGELESEGEEFECAQYIDCLSDVEYWIRNLSRKEGSFWLQTSTDKFYPDFVCKLKDGRYMAIEYKGLDRYDNSDSKEKRTLGEIWEKRSNGRCLFVMPTNRDFSVIKRHIDETKQ